MARNQLILDRYEPLGTAGAGGFGTVRIAWDQRIQRKVAIKTIPLSEIDAWRAGLPGADAIASTNAGANAGGHGSQTAQRWHGVQPWNEFLAESDAAAARVDDHEASDPRTAYASDEPFTALAHIPGLDEARTAAKLQDQRIVGVFDFEVRGQVAYLIMEYVQGITLTQLLAQYEDYLTLDVVAAVFDSVAGALSVAHKAGVLHLDIKPDNILINSDGQVKVTDFGLATLADASGTGLAGGGTIGYMPLEQMRREPLDVRTDEWALAAMTYEMLTGDNPFRALSLEQAERAIEDAELVLPSLCWDNVDEQIDDVIFYALDPERDQRYASVNDFAEEMDKFLGDARAGKRQLSAIAKDALGTRPEDDPEYESEDAEDAYDDAADAYELERMRSQERRLKRQNRRARRTAKLRQWGEDRLDNLLARVRLDHLIERIGIAAAVAYLSFAAMQGIYPIAPLLGKGAALSASLVCMVAVTAVALAFPHVGLLIAGVLTGFWLITANQAIAGAALIATGLVWCYATILFARQDRRPLLLLASAAVCVGALVAACVFAQPPQNLLAPPIVAAAAIAVSALLAHTSR